MARFGHHSKYRARAAEFLNENPGRPYCDDFLRNGLSITRANLTEKDAALIATENGFVREVAVCSVCRVERRTTWRIVE
jgi:hypothetical protein